MSLPGGATYIRPEHDFIRSISSEVLLVEAWGKKLDVATATVNILFELLIELEHKVFSFIGEAIELRTDSIEPIILASLESFTLNSVAEPFAMGPLPLSLLFFIPVGGDPSAGPSFI